MAPEIVLKTDVAGPKSDIWGLGVLLLELLELEAPMPPVSLYNPSPSGEKLTESEEAKREDPVLIAYYLANHGFDFIDYSQYSTPLQNFISRVLVLDPTKRASVDELLEHPFITLRIDTA